MQRSDILIAEPTVEPVTLAQAKAHLRVTSASEDALISTLIKAARGYAESFCTKALVLQSRQLLLDELPGCIEIRHGPVRAVQSIQYLDSAGVLQTLATTEYRLDKHAGRIVEAYDKTWPETYDEPNAVKVNYTAGLVLPFTADAATDVLTSAGHGFAAADQLQVSTLGGTLPSGLAASTNYHVRDATADTLKLAATAGGAAIDITANGTAPNVLGNFPAEIHAAMLLLIGHLFEHREETISGTIIATLPMGVEPLLAPHRLLRA